MAWNTLSEARAVWRDAPADDATLTLYLESAHAACLAFAPSLPGTGYGAGGYGGGAYGGSAETVPDSYRLAEIFQARNIWNSGKASPSGEFDGSAYGLSARPLDWQVKQLLRPQRVVGAIA